jgi:Pyruvate/2-oxoacid:ferredoxin oxidoreductase delta subunit
MITFSQPVILGMSFVSAVLILSVFIYRPWCHFFCPFGFISWIVEQKSLNKPVINLETCKQCQLCVKACPGNAMEDILHNKRWRSDCFACGACIEACRFDSIHWGRKSLSSRS